MKKKQGISLIVLVITIIVMIILAAAVVVTLNNTGIIGRANEAVDKTNIKEVEQLAALVWAEEYMDGKRGEELKEAVLDKLKDYTSKYDIEVTDKGVTVKEKSEAGVLPNPTPNPEPDPTPDPEPEPEPEPQGPTTITLSGNNTVDVKRTTTLTVTYDVGTPQAGEITWTSSNPQVATVDQSGVVTGVCSTKGTTTITAKYAANEAVVGTKEITVNALLIGDCAECEGGHKSIDICPYCKEENIDVREEPGAGGTYTTCSCGAFDGITTPDNFPNDDDENYDCPTCGTGTGVKTELTGTWKITCSKCNEVIDYQVTDRYWTFTCPWCESGVVDIAMDPQYFMECCNNNISAWDMAYDSTTGKYKLTDPEKKQVGCETCHENGNLYDTGE